jgi:glycosyltransferase involved in cell wall biosynthesis
LAEPDATLPQAMVDARPPKASRQSIAGDPQRVGQHILRVGIDARALNRPHLRGMGKYVAELVNHLGSSVDVEFHGFADRPDLPLHPPAGVGLRVDTFEMRGYRFRTWEQCALPLRARLARVDVLHCPMSTLPLCQTIPTVVTLHDTLPWQGSEPDSDPEWYLRWVLPRALGRSAAIITGSEHSKRDILGRWPLLEPKIHVITHGIDAGYLAEPEAGIPGDLERIGVRTPYFLYLGGDIPRKRLDWALRVFEISRQDDTVLVVCGVPPEALGSVEQKIPVALRSHVILAPFVPEAAMPSLMRNATAVLYPTLYEGFGFPVLEANAIGTPVLHSATSSLAELAGPASVVLPDSDLDAWVAACRRLASERCLAAPIESARAWARRFTWQESARKHLAVYRQAARRMP